MIRLENITPKLPLRGTGKDGYYEVSVDKTNGKVTLAGGATSPLTGGLPATATEDVKMYKLQMLI